jgi:hypothetical protein
MKFFFPNYFRNDNEDDEQSGNDEVHPADPPEEDEVGGDHGPEVRLDVLDPALPRNHLRSEVAKILPENLWNNKNNICYFIVDLLTKMYAFGKIKQIG